MTDMENKEDDMTRHNPALSKEPLCLRISLEPTLLDEVHSTTPLLLHRTITLQKYPQTGLDLKLALQNELQIPVSLQRLTLQKHLELTDDLSMQQIHLRQEDAITVHYTTQGHIRELQEVINILKELAVKLQYMISDIQSGGYSLGIQQLSVFHAPELENVIEVYFSKRLFPSASIVNHIYFKDYSGVDATVRLLELLTDISWDKLPFPLQFIEGWCIRMIWNISSTIGVRRFLLKYSNLVELLGKSILRVSFNENRMPVPVINDCWSNRMIPTYILTESLLKTVFKGIGVIANLAELEEYQLSIVQTPGLISQMTLAMMCPQYKAFLTHLTLSTLVCLSYCPSTHTALTQNEILTRVLETAKLSSTTSDPLAMDIRECDVIIINYFSTVFFALVNSCLLSNHDNHKLLPDILTLMETFLNNTTPSQVHQAEIDMGYFGTTIKPFVQLCYSSSSSLTRSTSFTRSTPSPSSVSNVTPSNPSRSISTFLSSLFSFSSLRSKSTPPPPPPPPVPPPVIKPPLINKLKLLSFQTGLFSILDMSLTDTFEDIVTKESLQDYLTCLPWYVKSELRDKARQVTHAVNEKMSTSPPKLVNILKACFATDYGFSLEQVMSQHFINKTLSKY